MNIEAKNLSKIYGDGENRVVALDHANLEIVSSDFISIMGPSGSGKSTLLHLLSGLDKPSSGSLTYDGKDIYSYSDKELSAFRRKRIGFIFQQFNLLPVLTAKENIIMPLLLDKQKPEFNSHPRFPFCKRVSHFESDLQILYPTFHFCNDFPVFSLAFMI